MKHGYCGIVFYKGKKYLLKGKKEGKAEKNWSSGNISGEVFICQEVIKFAYMLGAREIDIIIGYSGIKSLAEGRWKATKQLSQDFCKLINEYKDMAIRFKEDNGSDTNRKEAYILATKEINNK